MGRIYEVAVDMNSDDIYIPNPVQIGSGIQKVTKWHTQRAR
jgi:hypothetical protein